MDTYIYIYYIQIEKSPCFLGFHHVKPFCLVKPPHLHHGSGGQETNGGRVAVGTGAGAILVSQRWLGVIHPILANHHYFGLDYILFGNHHHHHYFGESSSLLCHWDFIFRSFVLETTMLYAYIYTYVICVYKYMYYFHPLRHRFPSWYPS